MWRDVFSSTTIASSTTKPVAIVSAISVKLLIEKPAQVHDAEGADERHRHGHARDQRRAPVAQEHEHDEDHQHDGDDQRALRCRAATRGSSSCAPSRRVTVDRARDRRAQQRQQRCHAIDRLDDVGVGLAVDDDAAPRACRWPCRRCAGPAPNRRRRRRRTACTAAPLR